MLFPLHTYIHTYIGPNYSHPILPFFAVFILFWAAIYLNFWEREESLKAMKWGAVDYESQELERPQFKGDLITSPINGKFERWYPAEKKRMRVLTSYIAISVMILAVLGALAGIYIMRFALESDYGSNAATIASFLNTVQIAIFNIIYSKVAVILNNSENHRTDTQVRTFTLINYLFLFMS